MPSVGVPQWIADGMVASVEMNLLLRIFFNKLLHQNLTQNHCVLLLCFQMKHCTITRLQGSPNPSSVRLLGRVQRCALSKRNKHMYRYTYLYCVFVDIYIYIYILYIHIFLWRGGIHILLFDRLASWLKWYKWLNSNRFVLANVSILLDCACGFLVKCGSKETSLADLQNHNIFPTKLWRISAIRTYQNQRIRMISALWEGMPNNH